MASGQQSEVGSGPTVGRGVPSGHERPALSIATSFDYEIPIDAQLQMIAAAGFTHVSLGVQVAHSDYLTSIGRARLSAHLDRRGLSVDTIHGPRADRADSLATLTATMEAAAELGAGIVVTHPGPFDFHADELEPRLDGLLRLCSGLADVSARTGVRLAFENVLPGPATDLTRLLVTHLDPRYFGFCYDSSHDQIGGPRPLDLPVELRDRLVAVQLSDRVRDFVDHVIPGEGFIDWPAVTSALRTSAFRGPLLLEVSTKHSSEKDATRFLRLAYDRLAALHASVYGPTSSM